MQRLESFAVPSASLPVRTQATAAARQLRRARNRRTREVPLRAPPTGAHPATGHGYNGQRRAQTNVERSGQASTDSERQEYYRPYGTDREREIRARRPQSRRSGPDVPTRRMLTAKAAVSPTAPATPTDGERSKSNG